MLTCYAVQSLPEGTLPRLAFVTSPSDEAPEAEALHEANGMLLYDEGETWRSMLGLHDGDALLVRPDGHIAWCSSSPAADTPGTLQEALDASLGRKCPPYPLDVQFTA